jgi:hypothetical protein
MVITVIKTTNPYKNFIHILSVLRPPTKFLGRKIVYVFRLALYPGVYVYETDLHQDVL